MNAEGFVALFKGYWPNARNVGASKAKMLWEEVIDGIPDDVVAYGIKRYARSKQYPPTVLEFERWLWPLMDGWADRNGVHHLAVAWKRRRQAMQRQEQEIDTTPPDRDECEGCLMDVRYEVGPPRKRFECDGGLVFREDSEGKWYAAICPKCQGPAHHRKHWWARDLKEDRHALPVPDSEGWENGDWKPVVSTPIADCYNRMGEGMCAPQPVENVVIDPRARHIPLPSKPKFVAFPTPDMKQYWAWVREAVINTRLVILGLVPHPFRTDPEPEEPVESGPDLGHDEPVQAEFTLVDEPAVALLEAPPAPPAVDEDEDEEPPF